MKPKLVVIGASSGGVKALQSLFNVLPASFTVPIVVIIHMKQNHAMDLKLVYRPHAVENIIEIKDKMPIEEGKVYFAPANYHVFIERDQYFSLSQDEPVNFARPSIDVLFESAAKALGSRVCGILLTGSNNDGAQGLKAIQENGGTTIVQNPLFAEFSEMPQAALKLLSPDYLLNLNEVAPLLVEMEGASLG